jgi:hypothetical protein
LASNRAVSPLGVRMMRRVRYDEIVPLTTLVVAQ